jgi:HD-like signal output (HDOD) protein
MPIVSLQQAISRLGITELRDMVYAVSIKSRLFEVTGYAPGVQALWQHAVGSAMYAKEIAALFGYGADKAFLWGLLHDVGKPVMLLMLAELQKELGGPLPLQAVVAALDAMHAEVGGLLAERWQLPVIVQECIKYHHNYVAASECPEAALVTSLADCLAHHLFEPNTSPWTFECLAQHPALEYFYCTPETLMTLFTKGDQVLLAIQAMS